MASESVATESDVVTTGTSTHATQPTWEGTWAPQPATVQEHNALAIDGQKVIYEVECTFLFSGTDSSTSSAVSDESTVTLTASTKVLQHGSTPVLVNNDSNKDKHDNEVKISSSNHLKTE